MLMLASLRLPRILALTGLLAIAARAQVPATSPFDLATTELARGNAQGALAVLDPFLAAAVPTTGEEKTRIVDALVLRARAREGNGENGDAALVDLARAESLAADRAHAAKISLLRARIYDRLKRRDDALAAARKATDLLMDPARRRQRAQIWLDAANVFLLPPADLDPAAKKSFQPNRPLAVELLGLGLETEALGTDRTTIEIERLSLMSDGEMPSLDRSRTALDLLAKHPDLSPNLKAKLLLVRGRTALALGYRAEAFQAARSLTSLTDAKSTALDLWREIADPDKIAADESTDDVYRRRQEATPRIIELGATAEQIENAQIDLGEAALATRRFDPAIAAFEAARRARPDSPLAADVEIKIATTLTASTGIETAITRLEAFLAGRTIDATATAIANHLESIQWKVAHDLAESADAFAGAERARALERARTALERFRTRFPASGALPDALLDLARLLHLEKRFDEALGALVELRSRFPESDAASEAWITSAEILADDERDPAAALALLDSLPQDHPATGSAHNLKNKILSPALSFSGRRPFRSDEKRLANLSARNLETIELSIYLVDLEEFFLATGRFDVLASLDVSLIEPASKRTLTIASFRDHLESKQEIDLGELAPGKAAIIAARSGDLEARMFALTTDLDAAVVRTANDWRLFGVDRKTGATTEIARSKIALATAAFLPTDAVLPKDLSTEALTVLAASQLGLAPMKLESAPRAALAAESVVFAIDRDRARPGETIHVFGRIDDARRQPIRDSLEIVLSDQGTQRTLARKLLQSDSAGAFATSFETDPALAGSRNLRVELWRGTGNEHRMLAFQDLALDDGRDPEQLDLVPLRERMLSGEPAAFWLVARNDTDLPIPGLPISVAIGIDPAREYVTGGDGSVRIDLGAEQTLERERIAIYASTARKKYTFVESLRSLSPELRFDGGLATSVLAGRSLLAHLRFEAGGDPFDGRIDFQLKQEFAGEQLEVMTGTLTTGADGREELSIEAKDPGDYRLTFEWKDDRGNARRVTHAFSAIGEGPAKDLLLCDDPTPRHPGERFACYAYWPFPAGPALLTVFGAELDRAEVVTLKTGANELEIVAPLAHVDHFEISLASLTNAYQTRQTRVSLAPAVVLTIDAPAVTTAGRASIQISGTRRGPALPIAIDYVVAEIDEIMALARGLDDVAGKLRQARDLTRQGAVVGLSTDLAIDPIALANDPRIREQLAAIAQTAAEDRAKLMVAHLELGELVRQRRLPGEVDAPAAELSGLGDTIGSGGGGPHAGGGQLERKYGGRGKSARVVPPPPPLAKGFDVVLDANGRTTVDLALPDRPGRFAILAIARDGISTEPTVRTFVVAPDQVVARSPVAAAKPAFDGFAVSDGNSLTLPAGGRSGLTTVSAFASPIAALDAIELPGGRSDLDIALWNCLAASEAVIAAKRPTLDGPALTGAALEKLVALRDAATDHVVAFLPASRTSESAAAPLTINGAVSRSSLVLFVLATANDSGAKLDPLLKQSLIATSERELIDATKSSRRALALAALARAGSLAFERLNRFMREADTLSRRDLALLAIALADSGRSEEALSIAKKLAVRPISEPAVERVEVEDVLSSGVEIDALTITALRRAAPNDPLPAVLANLFSGPRIVRLDACGGALPLWLAAQRGIPANYVLRLAAGGKSLEVAVDASDRLARVDLLSRIAELPAGDVTFVRTDGQPFALAYAATPSSLVNDPRYTANVRVVRVVARREGTLCAVGNEILVERNYETPPHVTQVAVGREYEIHLETARNVGAPRGYWLRTTLPPGCELVPGSVQNADEFVSDGRTLLFHHAATKSNIGMRRVIYRIRAAVPQVGIIPAVIGIRSGRFEPEFALSPTAGNFDSVPWDRDIDSAIEPTPDERYRAGVAANAAGRHEQAFALLEPLITQVVNPDPARAILRAALASAVALGKDRAIVDLFELAKERDPENVLTFASMDRISRAYAALGEIERAREVLGAIGDALFLQEARAVGRLESAGLDRMAMALLERLLVEHDDSDTLLETTFAVGQHAYDIARSLGPTPPKVVVLGQKPLTRDEWLGLGRRALEGRLVASSRDPAAEEVALTFGNLLLEAGAQDEASALAAAARVRYENGHFGPTWRYVLAYAALAKRALPTAKIEAQALVDEAHAASDPALRKLESTGLHMLAQIAHAEGDLKKARELYARVKDQIEDARLALQYLEGTGLKLPQVWVSRADRALEIPLERKTPEAQRGEVEVALYPVDLRLLYLKQRGFESLSSVELAGLPATTRARVKPTVDAARGNEVVNLGTLSAGAYLLILRDGDLHARSIAIVSDIAVDVLETPGGARVHVFDRATRAPLPDVVLTFVGSESPDFITRKTDLRGIAEASGLAGTLAVIAQRDRHFAFYQAEIALRPIDANHNAQSLDELEVQGEADKQLEDARARNDLNYRANFNRAQRGVEIQRTKK